MNAGSRTLVTARLATLAGFVLGGTRAAFAILGRDHVLEFQAGPPAPLGEKLLAVAQTAVLEGLGCGLLGLVLAVLAAALGRLVGDRSFRRFAVDLAALAAGFFLWVRAARVAEEALPFLPPGRLALLNLAGFAGGALAFLLLFAVLRRLPLAPARARLAALGDRLGRLEIPRALELALFALLLAAGAFGLTRFEPSPVPAEVAYPELAERAAPDGPNVVFVTIDTLRADHLSCYGYERPTSPFLDSVAAAGTRFADASAPAAWTKPSTGTLLTGLYPSRHGALYHGSSLRLPEGEQTLAEAFRERGYVTAGFVSNPNVKKVFDFDRGFDVFFDSPVEDTVTLASIRGSWFGGILTRLLRHQFNWKYENDVREMNRHVVPWLEEHADRPFFLYVHYIDPHIPYEPPAEYRDQFARDHGLVLFNDRKRTVGVDRYDGEIRYADEGLRELVGALEAQGVWENTLFVLTSDHGEEFFEHGVLGHGFSLYQGVIHVPLILRGPGVPAGRVVEEPVQIVDLAATLLEVVDGGAGDDGPLAFGDGRSFAGALRDAGWRTARPYFLENEFGNDGRHNRSFVLNGVRHGPWKLVLTEQNAFFPPQNPEYGREALYNVEDDPAEEHNRFSDEAQRALVEELLEKLRAHARFLTSTGFRDVEPAALAPDIEASLRALGY